MDQNSGTSRRPPEERDWSSILELANLAVAHVSEAPVQTEWLEHRRAFNGCQRHFVADRRGTVLGYGAVERGPADPEATYRVFVVTDGARDLGVAELLYTRVLDGLADLGAQHAWLREYASDEALITFMRNEGFVTREEYEHRGKVLMTLTKNLRDSAFAV